MERLFIAIKLPHEIKKTLYRHYSTLLSPLLKSSNAIRLVKEENLHITIHFLGDTEEEIKQKLNKELESVSNEFSPFSLIISGFGGFPNLRRPRVLWFGINNCDTLKRLYERTGMVLQRLDFQLDKRDFHPHLTVARINDNIRLKKGNATTKQGSSEEGIFEGFSVSLNKLNEIKIDLQVHGLSLYKSILKNEGPIYQELFYYSFKKSNL